MYASQSSGEAERNVLNHYNLQSVMPVEWPKELDDSEDDEEDSKAKVRRSRSRYSALERAASDRRTLLPGSQQTRDGRANLVQKDEADPLGGSGSVIGMLRQRGVPVEQDTRLRNKFLLSSTTFSPALFLSQAHSDATTDDLVRGMEYLLRSIDQKSASLKVLVETNFERFVRAKATIDNVYTEMRNQGLPQAPTGIPPPSPRGTRHTRQFSRNSGMHQRITSAGSVTIPEQQPSKNALRRETEYGTKGVKEPLLEVTQRAEDVWGPALGGRERETSLKAVVEAVEKDRRLYELGAEMSAAIQQKNYEHIVELYASARSYANQATQIAERTKQSGQSLSDDQIHRILVIGRMWLDVQEQIIALKRDVWRRLSDLQTLRTDQSNQTDDHLELIGVLLELGVEDNPIWVWLLSRYDNLKNRIAAVAERSKIEIEIMRRRIAALDKPRPELAAAYLRSASRDAINPIDRDEVLSFWRMVSSYVNKLVSLKNGLLGEIADFWDSARSFIDGKKQRSLPIGYNGESKRHHRLSDAGVQDLSKGVVELVGLVRDSLQGLFVDAPAEDLSSLYTPMTGATPKTPLSPLFSPSEGRVGTIDEMSAPPPSPKKGDAWESYAFWPPQSNALSAVHYISEMLAALSKGVSEMVSLDPVARDGNLIDKLRTTINSSRERCLTVVCLAWASDSTSSMNLEDWTRSQDGKDRTRLPAYFSAYERAVLTGVQQILYLPNATKPPSRSLVTPPSSTSIQLIHQNFTSSIIALGEGMLALAQAPSPSTEDEWILVSQAPQSSLASNANLPIPTSQTIDTSSRPTRLLLTLSNLKHLRVSTIPDLLNLFETIFTTRLASESSSINDTFADIDRRLFTAYTTPTTTHLSTLVKDGITSPSWDPSSKPGTANRPETVSPYVYAALLHLVTVHTEISTTLGSSSSSTSSNNTILHETLVQHFLTIASSLLSSFTTRQRYTLPALVQATLDTEFIAQTLSQYTSPKVTEIQNDIYVELDKRTTNDARSDLQKELVNMRGVLKRLRDESRVSFGCFKKVRREGERPRGERRPTE